MESKCTYKKLISGGMGFGYGSKYQLLRMLGWHRAFLNQRIASAAGVSEQIEWLDFPFDGIEDREIMNADFLPEPIRQAWMEIWPTNNGRNGLNWDAVGKSEDTYILLEAKANLREGDKNRQKENPCGGKHSDIAEKVFTAFQNEHNLPNSDWLHNDFLYQAGNRLVFLDFLTKHGIKAKLIYLLFCNGYELNAPDCLSVKTADVWRAKIDEHLGHMGISHAFAESMISFCYIDCRQKGESLYQGLNKG